MPFLSDLTPSFVDAGCLSATVQGPDACLLVHFLQSYFVLAPLSICSKSVVRLLSRITAAQRLCDGSVPPLQQGALQTRAKWAYKQQTNSCRSELGQRLYQLEGVMLGILPCSNKMSHKSILGIKQTWCSKHWPCCRVLTTYKKGAKGSSWEMESDTEASWKKQKCGTT